MGLIIFEVHKKGRRVLKNANHKLLWYEWAKKDKDGKVIEPGVMHKLQGGALHFDYDTDAKKMNVSAAPMKIVSYETEDNEKQINSWIEENSLDLRLTKTSGVGITVVFPNENEKKVKSLLEDTDFTYEIVNA